MPIYMQDVLGLDNTNLGNLQAVSILVSNLCKVLSGTLADVFSPARMIIVGTLLTAIDKPMFAVAGDSPCPWENLLLIGAAQ
jgi:nitrate/nitrite transporter NarK